MPHQNPVFKQIVGENWWSRIDLRHQQSNAVYPYSCGLYLPSIKLTMILYNTVLFVERNSYFCRDVETRAGLQTIRWVALFGQISGWPGQIIRKITILTDRPRTPIQLTLQLVQTQLTKVRFLDTPSPFRDRRYWVIRVYHCGNPFVVVAMSASDLNLLTMIKRWRKLLTSWKCEAFSDVKETCSMVVSHLQWYAESYLTEINHPR